MTLSRRAGASMRGRTQGDYTPFVLHSTAERVPTSLPNEHAARQVAVAVVDNEARIYLSHCPFEPT
jgi:hypothetical protein